MFRLGAGALGLQTYGGTSEQGTSSNQRPSTESVTTDVASSKNAPKRLLGVINGSDEFEFIHRVKRFEISEYADREPAPQKYLNPESLVPTNENFRAIAKKVTRGEKTDLVRARALYDHVIETVQTEFLFRRPG